VSAVVNPRVPGYFGPYEIEAAEGSRSPAPATHELIAAIAECNAVGANIQLFVDWAEKLRAGLTPAYWLYLRLLDGGHAAVNLVLAESYFSNGNAGHEDRISP
jgi:hypothetical protein